MNDGKKKKDILIFRIRNNKETAPCLQEFLYIYIKKKKKNSRKREKLLFGAGLCQIVFPRCVSSAIIRVTYIYI